MPAAGRPCRVLVLGTLDTKGEEFALLRDELVRAGCECLVMDLGVLGTPSFPPDITREQVVARAGYTLDALNTGTARGRAIRAVIDGGTALARELHDRGEFSAVVAMGGGSGTTIGTTIMDALPFGVPKLIVTTLSELHPWVHGTDVVVVRTLVDMVGLNPITRAQIRQAAAAIAGMARLEPDVDASGKSVVITCLGVTTPGVMKVRQRLLALGHDVIVLHFETHSVPKLVEAGLVSAMIDLTPNELIKDVVYPGGGDGHNRLHAVREADIPLITSAGGLDMILSFTPADERPEELRSRPFVVHSPDATLIRTSIDEQRRLGAVLGEQLARCRGPVAAVLPEGGFSVWDAPGKAFDQPAARAALGEALHASAPAGSVTSVAAHINDDEFADAVVRVFDQITKRGS